MEKGKKFFISVLIVMFIFTLMSSIKVDAVAEVKLSEKKVTLMVGETTNLTLKNAKSVKWSSANKKVATVNSKGVVNAIDKGKTKILAYDKKTKKTYSCTITVNRPKVTLWNTLNNKSAKVDKPFGQYSIESLKRYLHSMGIIISDDANWSSGDKNLLLKKGKNFYGFGYGTTFLKIISDGKTYIIDVELSKENPNPLTEDDMIIVKEDGTIQNILIDTEGIDVLPNITKTNIAYFFGSPNELRKCTRGIQLGMTMDEVYQAFGYLNYYSIKSDDKERAYWNTSEHIAKFSLFFNSGVLIEKYNVKANITFTFDKNDKLMNICISYRKA